MTQTALNFASQAASPRWPVGVDPDSIKGITLRVLMRSSGRRWRLPVLTRAVAELRGRPVTETAVSAKLRELRNAHSQPIHVEKVSAGSWDYWYGEARS